MRLIFVLMSIFLFSCNQMEDSFESILSTLKVPFTSEQTQKFLDCLDEKDENKKEEANKLLDDLEEKGFSYSVCESEQMKKEKELKEDELNSECSGLTEKECDDQIKTNITDFFKQVVNYCNELTKLFGSSTLKKCLED